MLSSWWAFNVVIVLANFAQMSWTVWRNFYGSLFFVVRLDNCYGLKAWDCQIVVVVIIVVVVGVIVVVIDIVILIIVIVVIIIITMSLMRGMD